MRTSRVKALRPAYSCSQTAAITPNGMTTRTSAAPSEPCRRWRENAKIAFALGRRITDEAPQLVEKVPCFFCQRHGIGLPGRHDLRQRDTVLDTLTSRRIKGVTLTFLLHIVQPVIELNKPTLKCSLIGSYLTAPANQTALPHAAVQPDRLVIQLLIQPGHIINTTDFVGDVPGSATVQGAAVKCIDVFGRQRFIVFAQPHKPAVSIAVTAAL